LGRAGLEKIVVKFKANFGKAYTELSSFDEVPSFSFLWKIGKDKGGLWYGFTTSEYAHTMRGLTDEQVLADALKIFQKGYPEADLTVERYTITRWMDDPYSLGSYTNRGPHINVDHEHGKNDPLREAYGRLRFAGEYMAGLDFGCAHGAYLSGIRAAEEFIKEIPDLGNSEHLKTKEEVQKIEKTLPTTKNSIYVHKIVDIEPVKKTSTVDVTLLSMLILILALWMVL